MQFNLEIVDGKTKLTFVAMQLKFDDKGKPAHVYVKCSVDVESVRELTEDELYIHSDSSFSATPQYRP